MPSGEKTPRQMPAAMEANKWKSGQSGNPSGRPRKLPISERYAAIAELPVPDNLLAALKLSEAEKQQIKTYGDALALSQFRAGIKGETVAAREIADRVEGRPRQAVEVSGPEGEPINVMFMSEEQLDSRIAELQAIVNKEKANGPQE